MSKPRLTSEGRFTAICMMVCAIIVIGLTLSGIMQTGSRSPVAQVAIK